MMRYFSIATICSIILFLLSIPTFSQIDPSCKPTVIFENTTDCKFTLYLKGRKISTIRPNKSWKGKVSPGLKFSAISLENKKASVDFIVDTTCHQRYDIDMPCKCDIGVVVHNDGECDADIFVNNQYRQTIPGYSRHGVITQLGDFIKVSSAIDGNELISVEEEIFDICEQIILFDQPCIIECNVIDSTSFEDKSSFWIDGGADAFRVKDEEFAGSGNYSFRLRDNSHESSIYSVVRDLSMFKELSFSFHFVSAGLSFGDSFIVELSSDGGQSYSHSVRLVYGRDFTNDESYYRDVIFEEGLSEQSIIRIRSLSPSNSERIYIDDIVIKGCSAFQEITNTKLYAKSVKNDLIKVEIEDQVYSRSQLISSVVNDELMIALHLLEKDRATINIYDQSGQFIDQNDYDSTNDQELMRINLEKYQSGIYYAIISFDHSYTESHTFFKM